MIPFLALAVLLLFSAPLEAEAPSGGDVSPYPLIPRLDSSDPVFRQYSDDVAAARKALAAPRAGSPPPITLYAYRPHGEDTLLSVAARCAVPYDAIATLNRIATVRDPIVGKTLLLPTLPALYLPDRAKTDIEHLLLASPDPSIVPIEITVRDPERRTVHCLPDAVFDGTVRAFFLTPSIRFPLPAGTLTSTFGYRKNPVTGNLVFHKGIDLAAPYGTAVLACADGRVTKSGYDEIYGEYVTIAHADGRESLYGHLSSKKIVLQGEVKSGSIIGTVGSTGQSTGPHLHFEIRENGVPKNPEGFLKRK